jgi:hypothetical protein
VASAFRRLGMTLRPELTKIVEELLRETKRGETIALDVIGERTGTLAISPPEIDAMLTIIESRGRHVASPAGGQGEANLKLVIDAARVLRAELGRPPKPDEIAERSGIAVDAVRHALSLAKIMQR